MGELMAAFSLATDLGNGFPLEKALRNALIAVRLAGQLGLSSFDQSDAYYVAMLRYIGCTGLDYEMGTIYGDAIAARSVLAVIDSGRRAHAMGHVVRNLGKGQGGPQRARILARFLASGPKGGARLLEADCEVVARLSARLGMGERVVRALGQMFERWDGRGLPGTAAGEGIEMVARVVHVAHAAEIHHRLGGRDAAREFVTRGRGGWFDPAVATAFLESAGELLEPIEAESIWDAALEAEPEPRLRLSADRLGEVTAAFADFVDLKSPYLLGHSSAVGRLASTAATAMGFGNADAVEVLHAGRLHDLGRVSVPNTIWDKPGPLSASDWERVRLHPYYSERVLSASPLLARFGRLAGSHHERLDGTGYHRALSSSGLSAPARLLAAADAFQAMTEPRSWRPPRTSEEAAKELQAGVADGLFDRDAAVAVCGAAGQSIRARATWPAGLTDREVDVLRLLARGGAEKQIARQLFISASTVHSHVVHIYEKIGVSSRAAAALFAVERELLEPTNPPNSR